MNTPGKAETPTVLVLGGTGRTGGRVVSQLLGRGARVRAIVRSAERLPQGVAADSNLTVVEADLLSMTDDALRGHVEGCDAVVSCLGHTISLRGVLGKPRDLVTQAARRVVHVAGEIRPATPIRYVLMSSVSVNHPGKADTRRGVGERAQLAVIRALVPPAKDNQDAADFFVRGVGESDPYVEWVVVRPDTLIEGDVSDYALHEELVTSLAKPNNTAMANVAHFMCELVCDDSVWRSWRGKLPVIADVTP